MKNPAILSMDQGTSSSRAILFDENTNIIFTAQEEFAQIFPQDGWVEHNPEDIWNTSLSTAQQAMRYAQDNGYDVKAIGITNQRETTLIWDKATGKPVYNAIVWQDRRTSELCKSLKLKVEDSYISAKTGLLLDPYFSSTKASWILDHVEGARERAAKGELAFGTVDSFLIWRLTGGAVHSTDATNASRTNLFNIVSQKWDDDLCRLFNVPQSILPDVLDSSDDYGMTKVDWFKTSIPIYGVAGDQQAAAIGQCCFNKGDIKSTYGTGCFVILNTGSEKVTSQNRLLSTVAYRLNGETTYALEGSIFMAGASVQWLRDEMGLIDDAAQTEAIVSGMDSNNGLYLVPAFTGLGAPYWDPDARGAIFGMSRATNRNDFIRATLESVAYQTHDLFKAMSDDGVSPKSLRVDGGMVANNWVCGFLANILNIPVQKPEIMETTALGVAFLAGMKAGVFGDLNDVSKTWKISQEYNPNMSNSVRNALTIGWGKAVSKVLS